MSVLPEFMSSNTRAQSPADDARPTRRKTGRRSPTASTDANETAAPSRARRGDEVRIPSEMAPDKPSHTVDTDAIQTVERGASGSPDLGPVIVGEVEIVDGPKAAALRMAQARAIKEILEWMHQPRSRNG